MEISLFDDKNKLWSLYSMWRQNRNIPVRNESLGWFWRRNLEVLLIRLIKSCLNTVVAVVSSSAIISKEPLRTQCTSTKMGAKGEISLSFPPCALQRGRSRKWKGKNGTGIQIGLRDDWARAHYTPATGPIDRVSRGAIEAAPRSRRVRALPPNVNLISHLISSHHITSRLQTNKCQTGTTSDRHPPPPPPPPPRHPRATLCRNYPRRLPANTLCLTMVDYFDRIGESSRLYRSRADFISSFSSPSPRCVVYYVGCKVLSDAFDRITCIAWWNSVITNDPITCRLQYE